MAARPGRVGEAIVEGHEAEAVDRGESQMKCVGGGQLQSGVAS
jgi:hypothetical protein